jgi:hypothetical protein
MADEQPRLARGVAHRQHRLIGRIDPEGCVPGRVAVTRERDDAGGDLGAGLERPHLFGVLDRAAADRMLVEAYHFPFPACGHMVKSDSGYELVPTMWQPL